MESDFNFFNKLLLIKIFKISVIDSLGFNRQNCDLETWQLAYENHLELFQWKEPSFLVKIKSIVDLCVLVKHVREVIKFVK